MSDLQHGLRTTYVKHRCRCDLCRVANRRYHTLRKVRGVDLVDSTPARDHIKKLRAAGMGRLTIAKRADVSHTVINRLAGVDRSKPAWRVRPSTLNAILSVKADILAPAALVDATGTCRRLQGLVAIGYPVAHLALRMGWTTQNLSQLIAHRTHVEQRTALTVFELFRQLCMVPGPSVRARLHAERRGWLPPLAWDDIDDPTEQPHAVRRTSNKIRVDDDELLHLLEGVNVNQRDGGQIEAIAERLEVNVDALARRYYRLRRAREVGAA